MYSDTGGALHFVQINDDALATAIFSSKVLPCGEKAD